jgi:hypothetical protein
VGFALRDTGVVASALRFFGKTGNKMRFATLVGAALLCLTSKDASSQALNAAYDGEYVGTQTFVVEKSSSTHCAGGSSPRLFIIKNGIFTFYFNRGWNWVINAAVASDGTISGFGTSDLGGQSIKAKIQGTSLTGAVYNVYCYYALEMTKR